MSRARKASVFILCCFLVCTLFVADASGQQKEIRILHMNDFHGFAVEHKAFGSDEVLGGIAYGAWRAQELRKEKPTLLLAAGDMIQGSNWANLFQGEPVIEVMNEMGFDAMVVGNHEFDFGQEVLRERIKKAHFPVLGANVQGLSELEPYVIKELNGIRIGIIGIVTADTPQSTHPRNVVGLKFLSPVDTTEKYVKELKGKVDIILVLSHLGLNQDMLLAHRVEGIDVVVGGHTHTKLVKYMLINKTIVVQAWEHGLVIGVLDLTVDNGKIVEAKSYLEEIKPGGMKKLSSVSKIVSKYSKNIDGIMEKVVGEAEVDLDGKNVRSQETNLGNLVADIMRERAGADGAIMNGGGIRTSISKGEITAGDVYSTLPFDNYVVAMQLTGKQLKDALEHGVSGVEDGEGKFPQISGIAFTFSRKAPKGERIKEVLVNRKPIDLDKNYTIATNDFLAAGGDGYKAFGDAVKSSKDFAVTGGMMKGEKLVYSNSGEWVRDIMIEYIKARKKIYPVVEGRIKELP
ncbi:MAG: multifunctional 2',3'-cyclic-nucleotide 2'-phosphodiesterase/5'-nucleotidase/3'-nucleotidase [Syntrophus sp. (in: bacteria)]|nr:multifunctional 2',3'-cyclic-nucleotide 2'-phosphodiesterase/5'-nucleotidase/3'-nucleotidase [Syntrophus sp. (in: bacteria)]